MLDKSKCPFLVMLDIPKNTPPEFAAGGVACGPSYIPTQMSFIGIIVVIISTPPNSSLSLPSAR